MPKGFHGHRVLKILAVLFFMACLPWHNLRFEPYYEGATFFLETAYNGSSRLDAIRTIVQPDWSHYYHVLPRIILLAGRLLGIPMQFIPEFQQILANAFRALCCATVCFSMFNFLFSSQMIQFLTAVTLLLFGNLSLWCMPNVGYFGAIPLTLVLLALPQWMRLSIWSTRGIFFLIVTVIVLATKGLFIVALPLFALALFNAFRKKRFGWVALLCPSVVIIALQLKMISTHEVSGRQEISLLEMAVGLPRVLLAFCGSATFGTLIGSVHSPSIKIALCVVGACLLLFILVEVLRRKTVSIGWLASIVSSLVLSVIFLLPRGNWVGGALKGSIASGQMMGVVGGKYCFLPHTVIHLLIAMVLGAKMSNYIQPTQSGRFASLVCVVSFFVLPFGLTPQSWVRITWPYAGYSQWKEITRLRPDFSGRKTQEIVFIPAAPYPNALTYNCDYLIRPPEWRIIGGPAYPLPEAGFTVPPTVHDSRASFIGLALKGSIPPFVEGLDDAGQPLGVANRYSSKIGPVVWYEFKTPLHGLARIHFPGTRGISSEIIWNTKENTPFWIWVGNPSGPAK